jgi:SAM-dependent methyltransferase
MSKWDDKYNINAYLFGTRPNRFLVESVTGVPPCPALSLGEGEGRNAVYLASLGFDVTAVDQSAVGLHKAQQLARDFNTPLTTLKADLNDYTIAPNSWDLIMCFFVHLPSAERAPLHRKVVQGLRPGGIYILEGLSPDQFKLAQRGPKDPDQCYSLEVILGELAGLEFRIAQQVIRLLDDAETEQGNIAVTQVLAFKPS